MLVICEHLEYHLSFSPNIKGYEQWATEYKVKELDHGHERALVEV